MSYVQQRPVRLRVTLGNDEHCQRGANAGEKQGAKSRFEAKCRRRAQDEEISSAQLFVAQDD